MLRLRMFLWVLAFASVLTAGVALSDASPGSESRGHDVVIGPGIEPNGIARV